jgi:hypothetical protein
MTFSLCKKSSQLLALAVLLFCGDADVIASNANCASSQVIYNQPLYFYQYYLGRYTVDLSRVLSAIKVHSTNNGFPFYKKPWIGLCPNGFHEKTACMEYTVYPDDQNFWPGGIMEKIKHYNHGMPNRGVVRILTNADGSQYVYTINHEKDFCGPYFLP